MSKKDFSELTEIATSLHNNFASLRSDAERRYQLYTLRKIPNIPEDIAREGQINMLSGLLIHSAHAIRADLMMNPTEFLVVPLAREAGGGIPARDARRADNLEKALAIIWSQLNDGRRIDREIIWHQLISPFGVMILESTPLQIPDQKEGMSDEEYVALVNRYKLEHLPWSVSTPDPMTCSFLEHKGIPTIFVRKFKQVVREVRRTYSRRGGDHENDDLVIKDGQWEWKAASQDYPIEQYIQGVDELKEVEMVWVDDGEYIYHIAMNPMDNPKSGKVVWSGRNPYGRVSAFVVGSNITPMRKPEDRWEPYLWSLMQTVDQVNMIRTIRATSAKNESGPDQHIPLDPNVIAAYLTAGKDLPRNYQYRKGEIPYTLGQIMPRPGQTSQDYDKLEQALNEDLQRFLPSPFVNVLDPAVLKAATASAILHAAEAGIRMYGPLMSSYDAQIKELMQAVLHSAVFEFGEESFSLAATGEEMAKGKPISAGAVFTLNSDNLTFPYKLNVKTRSMTQAQASAQYELALKQRILPDGMPGPMTLDDMIDAANISDKEAQKEKIAEEQILKAIDPMLQQMAFAAAVVEIEAETGLKLPIGLQTAMPGMEQGGAGSAPKPPSGAQRMDAPYVVGPEGGAESVASSAGGNA